MDALVVVPFVVVMLIMFVLGFSRMEKARDLVCRWLRTKGFDLLRLERRDFFQGPFFFRAGKHQFVYYVEVMDRGGLRRRGYIRVGSFWLGRLTDDSVRVRWVR